jgi:bifunctional UDP-N-acetylglucosamine pyrophosphorylase/glucosamine-1-phosphate N-acetyltransferase
MFKKVIILAAGKGTRMKELTKDQPKHLLEINGKPFLLYILNNLKQAGFEEFVIVYGYKGHHMEEFAKKNKDKFNITLINQFEILGDEEHGTARALEAARSVVGNENFIVQYGDNLYFPADLKLLNINDEYNYVCGAQAREWQNYGVLIFKDNLLEKIVEKPREFVSNIINVGLYKFTPDIFSAIKKVQKSPRGEYELTDAVNILAAGKKVKVKMMKGERLDLSKPEDIESIEKYLSSI